MTKDPVCGMSVADDSPWRTESEGRTVRFCSEGCLARFRKNPAEYVSGSAAASNGGSRNEVNVRQKGRGTKWSDYLPLFVIVALTLLTAVAKQAAYPGPWNWMSWMHDWMGFFLVVFSMFKFFNLEGFADGFQMYDLLAKPVRAYAYVYPLIELGLGLGYLSHWQPQAVYVATIAVMTFGSLGVLAALCQGLDLDCACMGTVLKVPLSTVALIEDMGMVVMAGAMLWWH